MNKARENPAPWKKKRHENSVFSCFPCLLLAGPKLNLGRYSCLIHDDILPQYGGLVKPFPLNCKGFQPFRGRIDVPIWGVTVTFADLFPCQEGPEGHQNGGCLLLLFR